jgi:hypothetical protein
MSGEAAKRHDHPMRPILPCEPPQLDEPGEMPPIEVRVYLFGQRIDSVRCESEQDVAETVRNWEKVDGVVCEVADVTNSPRRTNLA